MSSANCDDIINDIKEYQSNKVIRTDSDKSNTQNDRENDRKEKVVNFRQNQILEMMKANQNITTKELAKRLSKSVATINRDIEYLKKHNLIERANGMKYGKWIVK